MTSIRRKSLTANRRRQPPATLPTDIIFYKIFPRLPVKSLHRFRCVSTSFRHLPSDPTFLSAVRRLSRRRRYFLSFSTPTRQYSRQLALYSLHPSSSSGAAISNITPREQCTYAKMLNGLMLTVVTGDHKYAVISNAATNEKFDLPSFPKPSKTDRMFFYFCHDPATDVYKVLCTTAVNSYSTKNGTTMEYSVLTIGTDREWKDFVLPELYQSGKSRTACIDGTLYCTRFSRTGGDDIISVIAAFDVEGEFFYTVKYPDGLSPSRYNQCHLVELKGALAVIDIKEYGMLELWMKGGDNTWTERRIEFDPMMSRNLLRYYSLSGNVDGEIVVGSGSRNKCWIFVFNMEKGEWRRVVMEGVGEGVEMNGNFGVEEYVESPLPLEQMLDRWRVLSIHLFRDRSIVHAHA